MCTELRDAGPTRCISKAQPHVRVTEWLSAQFDGTGEHPIICGAELRELFRGFEHGQQFSVYRHPPLRLTGFDRPDPLTHDASYDHALIAKLDVSAFRLFLRQVD
ncbi:MAG: hypothetical protein WCF68_17880 [Terriglobales bacterium]